MGKSSGGGGGGGGGKSTGGGVSPADFTSPTGFQTRTLQDVGESTEGDYVLRVSPADIKRETDKAIGVDLGGGTLTFIPKSVIKGWYPGNKIGQDKGFVVETWYGKKNIHDGGAMTHKQKSSPKNKTNDDDFWRKPW